MNIDCYRFHSHLQWKLSTSNTNCYFCIILLLAHKMNPWIYLTVEIAMDNKTRGEQTIIAVKSRQQSNNLEQGWGIIYSRPNILYNIFYILYNRIYRIEKQNIESLLL